MIGQTVSHYKVVRKVGGGGMGVVYEAEDLDLDRHVALKFLPAELAENQDALNRFRREARAASALNHPHICTIHEIGEHEGQPFLILELLSGETLAERISRGPLPIDETVRFGTHLADALDTAHSAGIVHRDIKPANLFITERGDLKVLDFGLAKREFAVDDDSLTSAPTMRASDGPLTSPGTTMGTVHYMSPEQVRAEDLDARTDIFSAGVVIYEMATGVLPFSGSSPGVIFAAILGAQPEPPSALNREITPNLEAVIGRALAKGRDDRYQTALDLMTDLGDQPISVDSWIATAPPAKTSTPGAFSSTEQQDRPDSSISQGHSKLLWAAIAIVAILAAGSAWLSFTSGKGPEPGTDAAAVEASRRVVVLPFENLGPPEDEYFAAGITDEITGRLGSIGDLTVISASSARRYAGSDKTLAEISSELDVTHVISGSVRWVETDGATRVRIQPELVRVSDQARIWSDTIDEQVEDIFAIQGRIAERVASGLGIELTDDQKLSLEASLTENPEAYQAYLRGLEERRTPSEGNWQRAIAFYERALELDPGFAEAWAQISRTRGTAYRLGLDREPSLPEQIRSDADRAVSLKPESAAAQVALGFYYYEVRGDYERAAEILALVAKRHPGDIESANALAVVYRRLGRLDDSLREFERSLRIDPDQSLILANYGVTLAALSRWDEAARQYEHAIEVDPDSSLAYSHMANLTVARGGTVEEARQYLERSPNLQARDRFWPLWFERDFDGAIEAVQQGPSDPYYLAFALGRAYRAKGDLETSRGYFEQIIEGLAPMVPDELTDEGHAAMAAALLWAYAGVGNVDQTIQFGEKLRSYRPDDMFTRPRNVIGGAAKAYAWVGEEDRAMDAIEDALSTSVGLGEAWKWGVSGPGFRLDPDWDNLRGNPRFEAMIKELEAR